MKILYIHQYFKTPEEGGAIRSYYLAKGLVDRGHEVELITSHNEKSYQFKWIEGIKVHYLPVYYSNHLGFTSRVWAFVKFIVLACREGRKSQDVRICYSSSTPLTVGIIALILKFTKNLPYIFEVRDLWPEAPIQMGVIKNKLLVWLIEYIEKKIYSKAEEIIALSPGIKAHIIKIVPQKSVSLIPNMVDLELFDQGQIAKREASKIENEKFVITYFGAVGRANNLKAFIDIAIKCRSINTLKFQLIGSGSELSTLKKLKSGYKLENLEFLPFVNKPTLARELLGTHASYISYLNLRVLETSSPNKFFDSLAAGKLIILNFKGWLYELCMEHKCGIYIAPDKPGDFLSTIRPFLEDMALLNEYQENAKKLATQFKKEDLVKILGKILEKYG